jgi:hypothetical protein
MILGPGLIDQLDAHPMSESSRERFGIEKRWPNACVDIG